MLQVLKQSNFDFMKRGKLLLSVSAVLCVVSIGLLVTKGLNLGIEFVGGTELQLKFQETPDLADVRSTLRESGARNPVVTTIGPVEQNEIYIKIGSGEDAGDLTQTITDALRAGGIQADREDLNVIDTDSLESLLLGVPGIGGADAAALAQRIVDQRRDVTIFSSVSDLSTVDGVTPQVLALLEERAYAGPLVLRSQSYVGPAIGRELMQNALGAIIGSLLGMLVYIWIRFQLQWGFAAVAALAHDTLITLGLFSLFGKEMSLPVVAAFLTLVGYSVNDTVVVFDRIRENLKLRSDGLYATVNRSINQTLSRTIITSGLTFVVVFGLLLFGGAALNAFAFVLTAGVIVGTYSSIYIASPLLVLWKQHRQRREGASAEAAPPAGSGGDEPRRARKVKAEAAK